MPTRGTQQKPVPVCSLGFRAYDILGTGSGNGINDVTGNGQSGSNESLVARPLARNIYVPCLVGICVVGIYVVLMMGHVGTAGGAEHSLRARSWKDVTRSPATR